MERILHRGFTKAGTLKGLPSGGGSSPDSVEASSGAMEPAEFRRGPFPGPGVVVVCGLILLVGLAGCREQAVPKTQGQKIEAEDPAPEPPSVPETAPPPPAAPDPKVSEAEREALRETLAVREDALEEAKAGLKALGDGELFGTELLKAKREWALGALEKIGGSRELSELLAYLDQRGEADLKEWILDEGMTAVFSGSKAGEMRTWLRSLGPEEKELAVKLGFTAGRGFFGDEEGLKAYLATYTDENIQSAILSGYCCAFAAQHPEQAVGKFMSLRPEKVDASGVTFVMAELPPDTDFVMAGSGIPDDGQTLAKRARRAMLENWAGVNAQAAANYVMANTSKVHADQLGVVMEKWLAADAEAAVTWRGSLGPGEYRDQAYMAEARAFAKTDIARAWEAAGQVADVDRRIEAAKPVYEVWARRDPQGAAVAWEMMFNAE